MKTRQEYLAGICSHDEYYRQFVTDYMINIVRSTLKSSNLKKCFAEDPYLNNIKLDEWDSLAFYTCASNHTLKELLIKAKDSYSLATGVCIMKQAAKIIIETE